MTCKKIAISTIIVLVLFVSFTVFPWMASAYGWAGIGLNSLIITCVFVSI